MALTQTRPESPTDEAAPPAELPLPGGLAGVLGSGDHKTIGRLWIGFGLIFGVVAYAVGVLADLSAIADLDVPPDDMATQVVNFRPVALVFLFGSAVVTGLATYLVPLQVGSRTIAFPRAAAGAFWLWLIGSGMVVTAYCINGGPGGGEDGAGEVGSSLFLLAFPLVLTSFVVAATCLATTIFGLRTPGMSLRRVPMLSWSMLVTAGIWALSLPVLAAISVLAFVDFEYAQRRTFGLPEGVWDQIAWFFSGPAVYAVAIPVLGIAADAVSTVTGRRLSLRGGLMVAIGVFGAFSFGPWASRAVNPDVHGEAAFVGVSFAILVPVIAVLGALAAQLKGGSVKASSPLVLAFSSLILLLLAAVVGAAYSVEPLELSGTPFSLGHAQLVLAAAGAGLSAGLFLWAPKIWGHLANDGLGKLAAPLFLLGGVVAGVPQLVVGLSVHFDGLADANEAMAGISAVGDGILLLAVVLVAVGLSAAARGAAAADDPWGSALTLEWATSSPPPRGNFGELAPVASPEPLADLREGSSTGTTDGEAS
jgi:heme/copper-type cytochrome/quinol oxidase subunit 1